MKYQREYYPTERSTDAPQKRSMLRCDGQHWLSVIMCPLGSNLISINIHSESLPLYSLYLIGTVCTSGLPYSEDWRGGWGVFNRSKCKTHGHKGSDEVRKPSYSGSKQGKGGGARTYAE